MIPSPSPPMERASRVARRLARAAGWTALGVLVAWCLGALAFAPVPWASRAMCAALYAGAVVLAQRRWRRVAWSLSLPSLALVAAWLALIHPRSDRAWSPDQALLPAVEISGERLVVRDVRCCEYRTVDDYDLRHEDRAYDLGELDSVWFLVEPFSTWGAAAHTLLSFGFTAADGTTRYLAVSVEIRKERGEAFSVLAGLYRNYELMYVIGDERDLIRLRSNLRRDQVFLYPVRATRPQARALLLDVLARAEGLRARPEFYNTLTSTCTTNIVASINRTWPGRVPFSPAILFPGHADRLAWDIGLIDCELPFAQCRERHRINRRAEAADGAAEFSARIRASEP